MKLPAMQFYPGDWKKDLGVQSLSLEERGFWFELLLLMFESEQRGKLILNGQPMTDSQIANATGLDKQKATTMLTTLLTSGVASREPQTGALFCRRMVRDENLRQIRAEAGKMGGNPVLLKQNPTTHVKQNPTPSSSVSSSSSISSSEEEHPPTPHAVPAMASATPEVVDPVTAKIHELAETLCARHPAKNRCGPAEARKLLRSIMNHQPAFEKAPQGRKSERQLWLLELIDESHAAHCRSDQWHRRGYPRGLANWLAPTMVRYLSPPPADEPANGSLFADSKTVRAMEIYMARKEAEEAYETDAD